MPCIFFNANMIFIERLAICNLKYLNVFFLKESVFFLGRKQIYLIPEKCLAYKSKSQILNNKEQIMRDIYIFSNKSLKGIKLN